MTPLVPTGLYLATLGVLGLLIGSFLNVVIYRVPAGLSLVLAGLGLPRAARTRCARCDNVPVVSWLAAARRCRDCAAPISARYPLVELATALLFVARRLAVRGLRRTPSRRSR